MSKKISDTTRMQDRSYLAKDFASFKADLTRYARNYFIKQNADFSEASLGGMFVELAAYVGDSMSFFLDYQYNELQPETATNTQNIAAHARNAGVKIIGASPASTDLHVFIEVSAATVFGEYVPNPNQLPLILEGTTFKSTTGVTFTIAEDVDFAEKNVDGSLMAKTSTSQLDAARNPSRFILSRVVPAVSGKLVTETFSLGATRAFRKITLKEKDVSEVLAITDSDENHYYEVDFLSQNTAFKRTKNLMIDSGEVPSLLQVVSAARRFTLETNINSRMTTVQFGGGDENIPDNDAIPDPSELALPLYGRTTFTRFAIDPQKLLKTQTLGISPANTTLKILYRAGGGQNHNVPANTINKVDRIKIIFPKSTSAIESSAVVNSLDVRNPAAASGGLRAPSIRDIQSQIAQSRNQQSRIVTQDDLLARIYTLPSKFGRVYRASVRKSARNPLASELFVISRNRKGELTTSPDSLKRNLSTYLNEFRLISDALDVLDATVINYGIEYSIVTTPDANKSSVMASINSVLGKVVATDSYQIDQPLIEADFINAIINVNGVLSLQKLILYNLSGRIGDREYSSYTYDIQSNLFKGMVVGPAGSIFELKNSTFDIIGSAE